MEILESAISTSSADFRANAEAMQGLLKELKFRVDQVKKGGGEEALRKHKERGKLTARERIDGLIDRDSAFLEFSALAAWEIYENQAPGAGMVSGIGVIHGVECVIVANDATVK